MVTIYGDQAYGSSLLFYLRRGPSILINGDAHIYVVRSTFPDAPRVSLQDAQLLEAVELKPARVPVRAGIRNARRWTRFSTGEERVSAEASEKMSVQQPAVDAGGRPDRLGGMRPPARSGSAAAPN